jgi:hypothetical protein
MTSKSAECTGLEKVFSVVLVPVQTFEYRVEIPSMLESGRPR